MIVSYPSSRNRQVLFLFLPQKQYLYLKKRICCPFLTRVFLYRRERCNKADLYLFPPNSQSTFSHLNKQTIEGYSLQSSFLFPIFLMRTQQRSMRKKKMLLSEYKLCVWAPIYSQMRSFKCDFLFFDVSV